jgi:uncharacterized protein YqjF (DUF2071 family)
VADWLDALFNHFEVDANVLQAQVPFVLVMCVGMAYVSVVGLYFRYGRRPRGVGLARQLSQPLANHAFFNIRTYVRVNGEPGIYFLAEWIPNRLTTLVGPKLYGLPYRLGTLRYDVDSDRHFYRGRITGAGDVEFRAELDAAAPRRCRDDDLEQFLIERYSAFTKRNQTSRRFRIRHEPWMIRPARVTLAETSLLDEAGAWFATARYVGAHFSEGLHDVRISAPARLGPLPLKWQRQRSALARWAPFVAMVATALALRGALPAWAFMWAMCFAMYAGCKWASCWDALEVMRPTWKRGIGYLLAWPGMNARAFFTRTCDVPTPRAREWCKALAHAGIGAALMFGAAAVWLPRRPLVGGWTGMIGLVLIVHFGIFHWLSLAWRRFARVDAPPIMNAPVLARSVGEFWSARWNVGFHDLARRYCFNPLRTRLGAAGALMATLIVSGIVHDMVITLPARGGYGLPTLYFTIQGLGILVDRTPVFRRAFRQRRWLGRAFALAVVLAPVGLLFPPVFVERVIVPFLNAIGIR